MMEHLAILQIIVPLMAAPVCVLVRNRAVSTALTIGVSWLTFGLATTLLLRVLREGVITYQLGGWMAPAGIEYRVDVLSAFVIFLVAGVAALTMAYAPRSLAREVPHDLHYLFCAAFLLCLTGLLGIAITGDLFNVFVFLEISSLSSYALIALGRQRQALTSSLQYLVLGTIGATFILIGIGLMYSATGTLNMADMADRLLADGISRTVLVAFAFFCVGACIKMALFPLHVWLPNAYTFAPSVVTIFLAATATKVSVYILLRFVFTVYGREFAFEQLPLDYMLMPLALTGIFIASIVAVFQKNVKRMLAYSSVAQIGYMVLGISFVSTTGLTAGIVHLFNHALTKGGMFMALGCIVWKCGACNIEDLRGAGKTMPWTMLAWVIGGLGLIGVPLTSGFISKWFLIGAAMERQWWPVALAVLLSSLIAVVYVWRVVEVAYFSEPPERSDRVGEAPLSMLLPTWVMIGASVYFGIWTSFPVSTARHAAELLMGSMP